MLEVLKSASIKKPARIKLINLLSSEKTGAFRAITAVFVPDEASLGSVDEVHAVGSEVLPANFIGVVPQCSDLKHTHGCESDQEILVSELYCANLIQDGLSEVV